MCQLSRLRLPLMWRFGCSNGDRRKGRSGAPSSIQFDVSMKGHGWRLLTVCHGFPTTGAKGRLFLRKHLDYPLIMVPRRCLVHPLGEGRGRGHDPFIRYLKKHPCIIVLCLAERNLFGDQLFDPIWVSVTRYYIQWKT